MGAPRPGLQAVSPGGGGACGAGEGAAAGPLPEEVEPAVVEDGGVELEGEEVGAGEAQGAPGAHVQQDESPAGGGGGCCALGGGAGAGL